MPDEDFCKECAQKHDCRTIYDRLGKKKSPSVALKIVFAFLLPILLFITALAIFQRLLENLLQTEKLLTVATVLLALMVTFVYLVLAKLINKELQK